jgi:hypothetical protein
MPHYKDTFNKVHFLESVKFEHFLPTGCVQITESEAQILSAPSPKQIAEGEAREKFIHAKKQAVLENLPSLAHVLTDIEGLDSLIKMRAFLKKFATVAYMHIKETDI